MGIRARRNAVGQECPTYTLRFGRATGLSWLKCKCLLNFTEEFLLALLLRIIHDYSPSICRRQS